MADQIIQQDIQAEREIIVSIIPRAWVQWEGSASQLIDEGLVPEDIQWPERRDSLCWDANGLSYWLRRVRPPNIKGPMSVWLRGDWWMLRSTVTELGGSGFYHANLYSKSVELAELKFQNTAEGRHRSNRSYLAKADRRYMQFRAQAMGTHS